MVCQIPLATDGKNEKQYLNLELHLMNKFNPKKLLNSKWTAVNPIGKECHFIVTELLKDDVEKITGCVLEAVINNKTYPTDLALLKDSEQWKIGWKHSHQNS